MVTDEHGLPVGPPVPGWSGARLPQRCVMEGRFCRLEPAELARHGAALWRAHSLAPDGRHWAYLFHERPATQADFLGLLGRMEQSSDPLHWSVIDLQGAAATGTLSLMRIEPAHGVIEVGNVNFSPALQRTAASTEAQYLLMRHVFDDLGYRRYEWKCDSLNARSRATALRLGFSFEGIFRQAVIYKGRSRDTAWYSVTDREWPQLRAGFERWLSPGNMNPACEQLQGLAECREAAMRTPSCAGESPVASVQPPAAA